MEKIKVAVMADTYYPKVDGVRRFVEEFLKRASSELALHLVAPRFSNEEHFLDVKTTLLELSKSLKMFTYHSIALTKENLNKIKEIVQESDVVFVQDPGPIGYYALKFANKLQKKSVMYFHTKTWEFVQKYYNANERMVGILKRTLIKLHNRPDLLLIPYAGLQDELRKEGIVGETKVAQLGVDTFRFSVPKDKIGMKKKLGLPNKTIVGYVGRITGEKNTETLLRAFKGLGRNDVHLLMVGDGSPSVVSKFKETPNCTVTGFVENAEEYLQAMDIFVMPSVTETTSLATLEAMSCGVAVISTKVGFMEKYIVKGHNGVFFPKASVSTLRSKIVKLVENPELRIKLGMNARRTVEYSFSWDTAVAKIVQILREFSHK